MRSLLPPDYIALPPRAESDRAVFTEQIKRLAYKHGLTVSAVTSADPFPETTAVLNDRIDAGHLQGLDWFTKERAQIASDVHHLQESARSILSVGIAYWPGPSDKPDDGVLRGRISRYAWGRDYHRVLKRRMKRLHEEIEFIVGKPVEARLLTDTARVTDRAIAARSGLGWYGKHANVIVPGRGSWVLLGELVLDLDLEPDRPLDWNCGRCTICLTKCPTGAIVAPYTIDAPRCISYLTIELRGDIPRELRSAMGDWVYGCDVCQEVCPYTAAAAAADDAELRAASTNNAYPDLQWLLKISEKEFGDVYYGTPVPRTKRRGLARNAAVALGNIGSEADLPGLIDALTGHDEAIVRSHAAWAIGRIGGGKATNALDRARRRDPDPAVRDEANLALEELS